MFPLTLYLEDASLSLGKENDKLSNGKTGKKNSDLRDRVCSICSGVGPMG